MGDMADYYRDQLLLDETEWEAEVEEEEFLELSTPLMWTTKEGERIAIADMETAHLFNAMKMSFNHLAEAHGGIPVWFKHQYRDFRLIARHHSKTLATYVIAMLWELDRRTDLPAQYVLPLVQIRNQLMPKRLESNQCQ